MAAMCRTQTASAADEASLSGQSARQRADRWESWPARFTDPIPAAPCPILAWKKGATFSGMVRKAKLDRGQELSPVTIQ
jgi:hypothetical protein